MYIIAKKGTPLEHTIKEMCERIEEGLIGALDLVERICGTRPVSIISLYYWGYIFKLVPRFLIGKEKQDGINPKFLRKMEGTKDVYVPSVRYKEGKMLDAEFRKFAGEHIVSDEPLEKHGIHCTDWLNSKSYYCQPFHDKDNDCYLLICSDSITEGFDKDIDKSQFDIE